MIYFNTIALIYTNLLHTHTHTHTHTRTHARTHAHTFKIIIYRCCKKRKLILIHLCILIVILKQNQ